MLPNGMVTSKEFPHLGGNIDGGDKFTFTPVVWDYLLKQFNVRSVLDVGCAQGHALDWFAAQGVQTIGIEGLRENVDKCAHPVIECDFEYSYTFVRNIDLVWCCEVVEHISEHAVDNILGTISQGKILAMTYAAPGQEGYHHVNCRTEDYWIEKLAGFGMVFDKELTAYCRTLLGRESNHFRVRGLIFRREKPA